MFPGIVIVRYKRIKQFTFYQFCSVCFPIFHYFFNISILVLIIFGVMLTNKLEKPSINISSMNQFSAASLCIFLFAVQCFAIITGEWMNVGVNEINNSTEYIGNLILSDYLLPFEIVSLLLLGAMVGAATIARKKR